MFLNKTLCLKLNSNVCQRKLNNNNNNNNNKKAKKGKKKKKRERCVLYAYMSRLQVINGATSSFVDS